MNNLGELKWIFNKKGINQSLDEIRNSVIKNLKKTDGSPIDELENIPLDKVKTIVGDAFGEINQGNKTVKLLEGLNDPSIFNQIFEIVE